MLLEARENLEDCIVRLLGSSEPITADALAARIEAETGRKYTIQGIYKSLRGLQAAGVVVRAQKRYGLSMPWVVRMLQFARELEEKQLNGRPIADLLPAPGDSQTWIFFDLLRMDDFWNHLVISLLETTQAPRMYEFIPHPWFDLVAAEKEREFANALRVAGSTFYMAVGGRTPLDVACSKTWPRDVFVFSLDKSPWEFQRTLHLDVIGEFIITIQIQKRMAGEIDSLFQSVRGRTDLDARKVIAVLTGKTRVRLTLARDAAKAAALAKKFRKHFGLPAD